MCESELKSEQIMERRAMEFDSKNDDIYVEGGKGVNPKSQIQNPKPETQDSKADVPSMGVELSANLKDVGIIVLGMN